MNLLSLIARYLLGVAYIVFGLNFFFNFIPLPPFEGNAKNFMGILIDTKFFMVVKIIEIVGGAMLFLGVFPRLAGILLMPISVNILLFHTLIAQDNPVIAIVLVTLNLLCLVSFYDDLKAIFKTS